MEDREHSEEEITVEPVTDDGGQVFIEPMECSTAKVSLCFSSYYLF